MNKKNWTIRIELSYYTKLWVSNHTVNIDTRIQASPYGNFS